MKKGISLIILIITIVVALILISVVVLEVTDTDILGKAGEKSFAYDVEQYIDELKIVISDKEFSDRSFDKMELFAASWNGIDAEKIGTVKQYISSMSIENGSKFEIQEGELVYVGTNARERTAINSTISLASPITGFNLSISESNTFNLLTDGTAIGWGRNIEGIMGDTRDYNNITPTEAVNFKDAAEIYSGKHSTYAVMKDGSVKSCGDNSFGQLGRGTTTDYEIVPTTIASLNNPKEIAASSSAVTVLNQNGTVYTWGHNDYGQTGDGTTVWKNSPQLVPGLTNVASVSMSRAHVVALMQDGTVKVWGSDWWGMLGKGTNDAHALSPISLAGVTNAKQVATCDFTTIVLFNDGTVKAAGEHFTNTLASVTTNGSTPLTGVKQVYGGSDHILYLMEDGTLMTHGENTYGQLGLGHTNLVTYPTTIPGLNNIKEIYMKNDSTYVLFNDFTVKAWGRNDMGQLGDGTKTNVLSPVKSNIFSNR